MTMRSRGKPATKRSWVQFCGMIPSLIVGSADYEPERIDGQTNTGRVAKIVPGEDGILRLKLSNVDTFDNRCIICWS